MFLQLPNTNIQDIALIINTVLLIVLIVIVEFGFSEMPRKKHAHLRYLYPPIAIFIGLLILASYRQGAA